MQLIRNENSRSMYRSAAVLAAFGLLLFLVGFFSGNYATAFLGLSFGVLCLLCLFFIRKGNFITAKISWGIGTPILILASACLFTQRQPTTITSYAYLIIGGMLFCAYSFQDKNEKIPMWISIGLFFLGILFYDRIIIDKNFRGTPYAEFFDDNYTYFKVTQVIHFLSLVYLIVLFQDNKVSIEHKLSDQIVKLHKFTTNLISSSKSKLLHSGNLVEALGEILRNTSQMMDVSRMSVWEVDEKGQAIHVVVAFDMLKNEFEYDGTLLSETYPNYFKTLLEEKVIAAHNAFEDSRTKEFAETYLVPMGIKSMLDCPFFIDGKFKGILCCEEQRGERQWDEMDQMFAMAVTKLISISYYCQIRNESYASLKEATSALAERNKVLERVNTKMLHINGDLATDLIGKSKETQELQKFINEVSFKNSHHVRGPLSRILGLISLYRTETDLNNRDMYIGYLDQSAQELDEMIKEINDVLNKSFVGSNR